MKSKPVTKQLLVLLFLLFNYSSLWAIAVPSFIKQETLKLFEVKAGDYAQDLDKNIEKSYVYEERIKNLKEGILIKEYGRNGRRFRRDYKEGHNALYEYVNDSKVGLNHKVRFLKKIFKEMNDEWKEFLGSNKTKGQIINDWMGDAFNTFIKSNANNNDPRPLFYLMKNYPNYIKYKCAIYDGTYRGELLEKIIKIFENNKDGLYHLIKESKKYKISSKILDEILEKIIKIFKNNKDGLLNLIKESKKYKISSKILDEILEKYLKLLTEDDIFYLLTKTKIEIEEYFKGCNYKYIKEHILIPGLKKIEDQGINKSKKDRFKDILEKRKTLVVASANKDICDLIINNLDNKENERKWMIKQIYRFANNVELFRGPKDYIINNCYALDCLFKMQEYKEYVKHYGEIFKKVVSEGPDNKKEMQKYLFEKFIKIPKKTLKKEIKEKTGKNKYYYKIKGLIIDSAKEVLNREEEESLDFRELAGKVRTIYDDTFNQNKMQLENVIYEMSLKDKMYFIDKEIHDYDDKKMYFDTRKFKGISVDKRIVKNLIKYLFCPYYRRRMATVVAKTIDVAYEFIVKQLYEINDRKYSQEILNTILNETELAFKQDLEIKEWEHGIPVKLKTVMDILKNIASKASGKGTQRFEVINDNTDSVIRRVIKIMKLEDVALNKKVQSNKKERLYRGGDIVVGMKDYLEKYSLPYAQQGTLKTNAASAGIDALKAVYPTYWKTGWVKKELDQSLNGDAPTVTRKLFGKDKWSDLGRYVGSNESGNGKHQNDKNGRKRRFSNKKKTNATSLIISKADRTAAEWNDGKTNDSVTVSNKITKPKLKSALEKAGKKEIADKSDVNILTVQDGRAYLLEKYKDGANVGEFFEKSCNSGWITVIDDGSLDEEEKQALLKLVQDNMNFSFDLLAGAKNDEKKELLIKAMFKYILNSLPYGFITNLKQGIKSEELIDILNSLLNQFIEKVKEGNNGDTISIVVKNLTLEIPRKEAFNVIAAISASA